MAVWMHRPNGSVLHVDEGTTVHENLVTEGAVEVTEKQALSLAKKHEARLEAERGDAGYTGDQEDDGDASGASDEGSAGGEDVDPNADGDEG